MAQQRVRPSYEQAEAIRELFRSGNTDVKGLAALFGLSTRVVRGIIENRTHTVNGRRPRPELDDVDLSEINARRDNAIRCAYLLSEITKGRVLVVRNGRQFYVVADSQATESERESSTFTADPPYSAI